MNTKNTADSRLLIISNNVLSTTNNNGKTILSFIDGIEKQRIRQLYFHGQKPSVAGYSYYQLSDRDILKGWFSSRRRGRVWADIPETSAAAQAAAKGGASGQSLKKTSFLRFLRDLLWLGHWRSVQLMEWLDDFRPDTVFFVAGDSGFSYNIVRKIVQRYNARLVTYITDDYIMPRTKESLIDRVRRLTIRRKMVSCIQASDGYFTISGLMQKTYASITGKSSEMIMNMTPSLHDPQQDRHSNDEIVMVYTGSLYYGRDEILGRIADAAQRYNRSAADKKKIAIRIYSNTPPSEASRTLFERAGCSAYCGSLSSEELKTVLNRADVLLFVESFAPEMMEKTRYSLSTKVPEYMSVGKPILAVGPAEIGSMEHLSDVAFCANTEEAIEPVMMQLLSDPDAVSEKVSMAAAKYHSQHNIERKKALFFDMCFGNGR